MRSMLSKYTLNIAINVLLLQIVSAKKI